MTSLVMARNAPVTQRIEEVSGIRPVTLLIASGIVLITAILLATGLAANRLRWQALNITQSELARIDGLLAAATDRSFAAVDARLAGMADRLAADPAPPAAAVLRSALGRSPRLDAVALLAADGRVLDRAGSWPAGSTDGRDLLAALRAQPGRASVVGAAMRDAQTGALAVPLARRIVGMHGDLAGAVVALIPAADLGDLFAAASLSQDTAVTLLRADGSVLLRYPAPPASAAANDNSDPTAAFPGSGDTVIRGITAADGEWRLEAVRALPDYPVAVAVSRGAEQALAGWARQGLWFGAFALFGAIGIGVMVYLIARQFQTHALMAAMRVDRIEMERARFEAELLKSERLSVLGQLTATVAHELRNPLSAIRNTLFTVKEVATTAGLKLDRPIARMERSIERCDRIISDLLEYTRARELKRTALRFDRWMADLLAEQNLTPPVELKFELGAPDAVLPLDADRIRRVIINLVENAAQALGEMPADRAKRITVRTVVENRQLVLTVEDTGPGIAPDNLSRIFEPLFSTKSFGTGLGLPTVKQIVNQHGGMIAVESEVGRGTCVRVRLPLDGEASDESMRAAA